MRGFTSNRFNINVIQIPYNYSKSLYILMIIILILFVNLFWRTEFYIW